MTFHHPIINNGTNHPADEMKIYPQLEPLICHKIDLILSGHEHIVSHLTDKQSQDCGWEQVISGTGGMSLYGLKTKLPSDYQVFFTESAYGFAFFEAGPRELKLSFIRADGSSPYQHVWKKP